MPPPGIRSRIAPNARDTPPPKAKTPEISRAAMPAIFWTTDAAMVVLPCAVSSASRAGEPIVAVGVVTVVVVVADVVPVVGLVMLRFLLGRRGRVVRRTRAGGQAHADSPVRA